MARIKTVLFTSKQYKDKTFPVMIRVSHRRKLKYFYMKISVIPDHWDKVNNRLKTSVKDYSQFYKRKNIEIRKCEIKLLGIICDLEALDRTYTINDIEKRYETGSGSAFHTYADKVIKELESMKKFGNAIAYKLASSIFIKFMNHQTINLDDIDYVILKKFETQLASRGVSVNGISFYMRTIRAIYNRAIKEGCARKENYPFIDYKIRSEKTQKRALSREHMIQIRDLDLSIQPRHDKSRDLFMFSFYCMGISFVDIAHLKVRDIQNGRLNYSRKKNSRKYTIALIPSAVEIINKYSDQKDSDEYVFPILDKEHADNYTFYLRRMHHNNVILKEVGEMLEFPFPLTSYVARHSWATIAKRSGVPTAVISEGLGHTTEKTTQIYLDSFENEVLDAANRMIML